MTFNRYSAATPRSSLRMRMASSTRERKILPSPILPVRIAQRECGMAAAIIELNSLPDAVGPTAENDDFFLLGPAVHGIAIGQR